MYWGRVEGAKDLGLHKAGVSLPVQADSACPVQGIGNCPVQGIGKTTA